MTIHYEGHGVTVHAGDCLEVLAELADASVDSVVTDPPYGISFMGKEWDQPGRHGSTRRGGHDQRFNGGTVGVDHRKTTERSASMHAGIYDLSLSANQGFQAWCQLWATECLRVLKPGGHLLAFGGTRTSHRLASAIEDAGFEIRDSLVWLYGQGFPKSLDVGKAIDRGHRRDYVAAAVRLGMEIPGRNLDDWTKETHSPGDRWWAEFRAYLSETDWARLEREVVAHGRSGAADVAYVRDGASEYDITAPATDAARTWDGWGTALKPGHEPIVVARKPLTGTVAATVLAHGTGALNIDGCRVEGVVPQVTQGGQRSSGGIMNANGGPRGTLSNPHTAGRWPANVVLTHADDCSETVCAEGCPVAQLDKQSGESGGGDARTAKRTRNKGWCNSSPGEGVDALDNYGDSGGASRFYYTAKASTTERVRLPGETVLRLRPDLTPAQLAEISEAGLDVS